MKRSLAVSLILVVIAACGVAQQPQQATSQATSKAKSQATQQQKAEQVKAELAELPKAELPKSAFGSSEEAITFLQQEQQREKAACQRELDEVLKKRGFGIQIGILVTPQGNHPHFDLVPVSTPVNQP